MTVHTQKAGGEEANINSKRPSSATSRHINISFKKRVRIAYIPVDDEPRRVLARHRVFADTLHPRFACFENGRVRVFRLDNLYEFHHLHRIEEV